MGAQWDYTLSHCVRGSGSGVGFYKAGSSAKGEVWHDSKLRAALPRGQLCQRVGQAFAITGHAGTAPSCAAAGNVKMRPYSCWKAAVKLKFSLGMLNLLALPKELGPEYLPPYLWRALEMLGVKEMVWTFAFWV